MNYSLHHNSQWSTADKWWHRAEVECVFVHMSLCLSDSMLKLNHCFWIICLILSVLLVSNWKLRKDDRTFTKPYLRTLVFSSFIYQITNSKTWFTFKVYPGS